MDKRPKVIIRKEVGEENPGNVYTKHLGRGSRRNVRRLRKNEQGGQGGRRLTVATLPAEKTHHWLFLGWHLCRERQYRSPQRSFLL